MSTEVMSGRERILAALKMQEVDRVPCVPLIVPYTAAQFPEDAPYYLPDIMKAAGHEVWTQIVSDYNAMWVPTPDSGVRQSRSFKNGDLTITYETPVGTICEILRSGINSSMNPHVKHMICSVEDLKVFKYILEHSVMYGYSTKPIDDFNRTNTGDAGILANIIPLSPLQDFLNYKAGVDNTYYIEDEDPDLFTEVMELYHQQNLQVVRKVAEESDAEVFVQAENISSTIMSPSHYEKYVLDYDNEYADILHEHGKIHVVHMCGKLQAMFPQIAQGKFDCVSDIAPEPTGNTELWEAAGALPNHAVKGGIGVGPFTSPDPHACYLKAMEILEKTRGRRGVLLGSADSVPCGTTMEHLKEIRCAVDDFYA